MRADEQQVDLLYLRTGGVGWGPIDQLADLIARLLPANLTVVADVGRPGRLRQLSCLLPATRRRNGRHLLVLASVPGQLVYTSSRDLWIRGYESVSAWVIDSFWTDRISRFARRTGRFDHVFITDRDLLGEWQDAVGTVTWLPWGADCLAVPTADPSADRPVDLLRTGRQPAAWDDDAATADAARRQGLVFAGRPPFHEDPAANQQALTDALRAAKFALAHTNLVDDSTYTHPTREYITGRWMAALAAGTPVVGRAPAAASWTLWDDACLDVDPFDLESGMEQIAQYAAAWTPQKAAETQRQARAAIDWRYRVRTIAAVIGLPETDELRSDLARLSALTQRGMTGTETDK
ncbi:glycosyltransferase family 1 protein [Helcobacillus massiliensis]|uniref:glycosyltransferase family 1 protein n=1 Tax=Helcobacillus TaxID=1161125 RepID=UPI001EF4074D|nr:MULTISPECIES: glycosyltransferase family 1 protein [Helcobacillus]MCG7427157.1 glycosyltransferase family 1 protein [Helcobacillus sp. ACRRO]MCT1556764.1 glycosyltransferase family 1 protein [Helcobacillus massiliensis]MCT2035588.1 glycosyltransferase family 1 protein [Helcobacillus massiliensis]MCT2330960.1 glycosyltransferase family 1 protein [Helcobacillus massiliensis]